MKVRWLVAGACALLPIGCDDGGESGGAGTVLPGTGGAGGDRIRDAEVEPRSDAALGGGDDASTRSPDNDAGPVEADAAVEPGPEPDANVVPGPDPDANVAPGPDPDVAVEPEPEPDAEVDRPPPPPADPRMPGPFEVQAIDRPAVNRGGRQTPLATFFPRDAGPAPLVVFIPGFQIESNRYTPLMEYLASHGFAVARTDPPDPLLGVSHVEMAADVSAVIDEMTGGVFADRVDPTRIGTIGHSLGGKVAVMTAFRDDRVDAVFTLDPVNAGSPATGFSDSLPDIVPDEVAALDIPLGFTGETTDSVGGAFGPACAPAEGNFLTFVAAAGGSPWAFGWDILGADHMDFVYRTQGCLSCGFCMDGEADGDTVRGTVQTLSAAFLRQHLLGDDGMEGYLTGADQPDGVELVRP